MKKKYYTPEQAAEYLNIDISYINSWIALKELKTYDMEGDKLISEDNLIMFFRKDNKVKIKNPEEAPSTFSRYVKKFISNKQTRRDFLVVAGTALATLMIVEPITYLAEKEYEAQQKNNGDDKKAKFLFRDLFQIKRGDCSYSFGKRYKNRFGYHPDNFTAGVALLKPLGLVEGTPILSSSQTYNTINPNGDIILIGGPVGTILSKIAFEFEGNDDRHLHRKGSPLIPLRWYGMADEDDSLVKKSGYLSYHMEGVGRIITSNWPLIDTKTKKVIPTLLGKKIKDLDKDTYLPEDNYLTITKLPNFLSTDFKEKIKEKVPEAFWPYVYIFDGRNGLGTRAAELLVTRHGLKALEDALSSKKIDPQGSAFQITFRTKDLIETIRGYHKFTKIEFWDAESIQLNTDNLIRAHQYAQTRLSPVYAQTVFQNK